MRNRANNFILLLMVLAVRSTQQSKTKKNDRPTKHETHTGTAHWTGEKKMSWKIECIEMANIDFAITIIYLCGLTLKIIELWPCGCK